MSKAGKSRAGSTIWHGFAEIGHWLQEKITYIMKTRVLKPEGHYIKWSPAISQSARESLSPELAVTGSYRFYSKVRLAVANRDS